MERRRWRGIVGASFMLAFVACKGSSATPGDGGDASAGGDASPSDAAAEAGDAGGSGGSGGGGGGAGGARAPGTGGTADAQYAACVTYFRAECNRRNVCAGLAEVADPCPTVTDGCPGAEFAPGTPRTVESLLACAEDWKTFPCADVAAVKFPACSGVAGTLPDGSPCTASIQCRGTVCVNANDSSHPGCGTCQTRLASGAPCSADSTCPYDEMCNGVCTTRAIPPYVGQSCGPDVSCGTALVCTAGAAGMTCQLPALPKVGASCATTLACDGAVCSPAKTCVAFPTMGMPCQATVQVGGLLCATPLVCDRNAPAGPTCIAPPGPGTACTPIPGGTATQLNCAEGLVCGCAGLSCSVGTCRRRRQLGDTCTDANDLCVPGTLCASGVCVASGQDLMTLYCGG